MSKIAEISFVCLGNICRSPLAQGVFQDLVNQEKLDQKIIVTSAGTGDCQYQIESVKVRALELPSTTF
jgi:protein-tyrosine-phosphatase